MQKLIFLLVVFLASPIGREDDISEFVVWGVGQGLWTTWIDNEACMHFDIGGEHAPWSEIKKICGKKRNAINISHWDLDHVSFAQRASRELKNVCLLSRPRSNPPSSRKARLFKDIPTCVSYAYHLPSQDLAHGIAPRPKSEKIPKTSSSNAESRVFFIGGQVLVPGDSPQAREKLWAPRLPFGAKVLVLGHHGSRTSTSRFLLEHLPLARMAIASARKNKYGHPHKEVATMLRKFGIALLRTDEWGSIRFADLKAREPVTRRVVKYDKAYNPCSSCERRARKSPDRHTR